MDYEWDHFFLWVIGPSPLPGIPDSWSGVPCPYPAVFTQYIHVGESVVCTTLCYVVDDGR